MTTPKLSTRLSVSGLALRFRRQAAGMERQSLTESRRRQADSDGLQTGRPRNGLQQTTFAPIRNMQLATEEHIRLARRATVSGSLELCGRLIDQVGPRLNFSLVDEPAQWYVLHCVYRAAKLYRGEYILNLVELCADANEPNIDTEYERLYYLLTTKQISGPEIEAGMAAPDELGFYVATQIAEAGYDAMHTRAVEMAVERLERGFTGQSLMHREYETALAKAFYDRLCEQPVDLSGLLVIMGGMNVVQRQRANIDLDRYFGITEAWRDGVKGMFK